MKKSDAFPSRWLKADDLNGRPLPVVVQATRMETLKSPDGKSQDKLVVGFKGLQKELVVNMTNWDSISEITGNDDSDSWAGAALELYPTETRMGGKTMPCIRIRHPQQAALPVQQSKRRPIPEAPKDEAFNDEIPGFD